jgi:hypothetical protein
MGFSINTKSGGLIELGAVRHRFYGDQLVLHVDQTANINNGDGDASIVVTIDEIKDLIGLLNSYLASQNNGIPYVVLAENLLHPAVKVIVDFVELQKSLQEKEPTPIDLGSINGSF